MSIMDIVQKSFVDKLIVFENLVKTIPVIAADDSFCFSIVLKLDLTRTFVPSRVTSVGSVVKFSSSVSFY